MQLSADTLFDAEQRYAKNFLYYVFTCRISNSVKPLQSRVKQYIRYLMVKFGKRNLQPQNKIAQDVGIRTHACSHQPYSILENCEIYYVQKGNHDYVLQFRNFLCSIQFLYIVSIVVSIRCLRNHSWNEHRCSLTISNDV